jgi:hypothetical protein
MFSKSVSNRTFGVISVALLFAVAALTVALRTKAVLAQNGDGQAGTIHVIKDCSQYNNNAGDYCTIVSSNLRSIPPGAHVFYTQAAPAANPGDPFATEYNYVSLDSNVVLHVATGDWAVGRCTLNPDGATGLCTFSDGTGPLAGFTAHVNVSFAGGNNFRWDGTYSFSPRPVK